jgi:hypothetical protein
MPTVTKKELEAQIDAMDHALSEKDQTIDHLLGNLTLCDTRYADAVDHADKVEANRRGLQEEFDETISMQAKTIEALRAQIGQLAAGLAEQEDINSSLSLAYELVDEAFDAEVDILRGKVVYLMGTLDLIGLYGGTNIETVQKIAQVAVDELRHEVRSWLVPSEPSTPDQSDIAYGDCCRGKAEGDPSCCKVSGEDCGPDCAC